MLSAVRYSVTAHCFIHTAILALYLVVFISKIQSPMLAEIQNLALLFGKVTN